MYARERRRRILELLEASGRVTVTELAVDFDITTETVRRDLDQLAAERLLVRVHGGAVPPSTAEVEPDLEARRTTNVAAKRRIARAAASLLPADPRAAVMLDAGTTVGELIPHLSGRRGPVITHAPAIAQGALVHTDLEVHVLPGRVRPTTQAAVGAGTVEAVGLLHPELVVLGCNGFDPSGFTTPDPDEAAVKSAMARCAARRVVLADSSKAGTRHLVTFATTAGINALVTDDGLPAELAAELEEAGIEVLTA